jgi:phage protein D
VSARLSPYLISVQVIDSLSEMPQCNIELDDRNAELQIPPDGDPIYVALGWAGEGPRLFEGGRGKTFEHTASLGLMAGEKEAAWGGPGMVPVFIGWVTSVESGFGRRGGGRRLWIEAKGNNDKSTTKELQRGHVGEGKQEDGGGGSQGGGSGGGAGGSGGGAGAGGGGQIPMQTALTQVFAKSGLSVKLSPQMAKIKRDYWNWNDSPMNLGRRLAEENGGFFTISNNIASMVGKGEFTNADGTPMPNVEAVWGVNLIGWRIKPYTSRPQYGGAAARHFDFMEAAWKTVEGKVGGSTPFGGAGAIAHQIASVADSATAEQNNAGAAGDASSNRGHGWVLLNGEPNCKAGGMVTIVGARPGIDCTYLIEQAEHNYTRGVGYTTRCNVMYPTPIPTDWGWSNDPGMGKIPTERDKTVEEKKADVEKKAADERAAEIEEEKKAIEERQRRADQAFIEERANSDFVPGRAPFDNYWGWMSGEPSARDIAAAKLWYERRNQALPPAWQKYQ